MSQVNRKANDHVKLEVEMEKQRKKVSQYFLEYEESISGSSFLPGVIDYSRNLRSLGVPSIPDFMPILCLLY